MEASKILAVAAEDETGLDGSVAGHFGRCPAWVVVWTVGNEVRESRVVPNPHGETHRPGQVPQFIRKMGVDAVLAGGMGRGAVSLLSRYGIEVATGLSGRIRDAVGDYLRGEADGKAPCRHDHAGCGGRGAAQAS